MGSKHSQHAPPVPGSSPEPTIGCASVPSTPPALRAQCRRRRPRQPQPALPTQHARGTAPAYSAGQERPTAGRPRLRAAGSARTRLRQQLHACDTPQQSSNYLFFVNRFRLGAEFLFLLTVAVPIGMLALVDQRLTTIHALHTGKFHICGVAGAARRAALQPAADALPAAAAALPAAAGQLPALSATAVRPSHSRLRACDLFTGLLQALSWGPPLSTRRSASSSERR